MANPRYMNSKFNSTCCDCGRDINAGERIRYLGRSKAECSDCMPAESNGAQAVNKTPAANDWASALAWDESEPAPGASIGATQQIEAAQRGGTPVAEIVRPVEKADYISQPVNKVHYLNDNECDKCGKVDALSHNDATGLALCQACDDDQLADTGAQIIEQAKAKAEPPAVDLESFEFSNDERAEALASELLIILVNAIDVAGISGRHTLASYCRMQSKRALDMSSRQHIWHGIAQAIDRA